MRFRFYLFCTVCFLLACLANWNGSSASLYQSIYKHGAAQPALFGQARETRSDEWSFLTPAILNQALRADKFAAEDTALGPHFIGLLGNIPVRHISTLFRPQFWAFFVLPPERAFSVYWQSKALLLVTGIFTWLLLLTRSMLWSIAGSLWYFFSPFTQWTYSWASGLPEMVGLLCWTMACANYLMLGRNKLWLCVSAVAGAACAINFVLCGYPPHLIPLFWLAVFFLVGQLVAQRREIFVREAAGIRIAALCCAVVLIAIVGAAVYHDVQSALVGVAHTTYPGQRHVLSGSLPHWQLPANFFQWWETEFHFPTKFANICEGSGFLWLAPACGLLAWNGVCLSSAQKFALGSLCAVSLLMLVWDLVPVPDFVGALFGFERGVSTRILPALGLANIAIVAIMLSASQAKRKPVFHAAVALGAFLIFLYPLRSANRDIASFFPRWEVYFSAAIAAVLTMLTAGGFQRTLALCLVVPQALLYANVNPLENGLGVFTHSELASVVSRQPELLRGNWLVFSSSVVSAGFFKAMGCNVYNGGRFLPDVDNFPLFAHDLPDMHALNNSGYLLALPQAKTAHPSVDSASDGVATLHISPTDDLLPKLSIVYEAFDFQPSAELAAGLIPLADHAVDGFWLYRRP